MAGTTFDTLAYARRLTDAGIDAAHANAHADAANEAITEGTVSKEDFGRFEGKVDGLRGSVNIQTVLIVGVFITVLGAALGIPLALLLP